MTNIARNDVYQHVTDIIIDLLENHQALNYSQAWVNISGGSAHNAASRTDYNGINQILLSFYMLKNRYAKNAWLTFLQAKTFGATVKAGSKAKTVVFNDVLYFDAKGNKLKAEQWKQLTREQQAQGKKVHYLKEYKVFNVSEVEGLPAEFYHVPDVPNVQAFEKDERAETLIYNTGAKVNYIPGNRAYYSPAADMIVLPVREQFTGAAPFYATAFHELAHWTGAPHRLNREKGGRFGDAKYAKEELVAELTAAFLCASLGFEKEITNNAAYIKSWLHALKDDPRFIIIAAAQATKAADFIHAQTQATAQAA